VRLKDFAYAGNLELQCCKSLLGRNEGYLDSRLKGLLERLGGDGQQGCGCCCCDLRPLFHNSWLLCRGGKFGEFGVVVDDDGCVPFTVPPGVAGGLWRLELSGLDPWYFVRRRAAWALKLSVILGPSTRRATGKLGIVNMSGDACSPIVARALSMELRAALRSVPRTGIGIFPGYPWVQ